MKNSLLCLALLFSFSCAELTPTAAKPMQIENIFELNRPFDKVWQAVIETFSDMNYPIANIEKASGLIMTDWQTTDTSFCDCGKQILIEFVPHFIRGKFNIYVKKIDEESCEYRINCIFEMLLQYSTGTQTKICYSNGLFEKSFRKSVLEKVQ
jgi:hypothetical protein